ncbi:MAG: hypothetical protein K0R14_433 [Burkholderiales bacterium]|jgi:hypothetical protein|nr:hypothetical protein [Burkholderiales bacterium]
MSIALHFDTLDYVEKAEKLGVSKELAKFQAREMESLYNITIDEVKKEIKEEFANKDLATKGDIRESELRIKVELIKWILGTGVTSVIILSGAIFTMLKLMLHI